jgi:phosphomannomutase/phosphoglucomutase
MLKLKKKNAAQTDNAQGFAASGNSLAKICLVTLLVGLIPILAGFSYLLMIREPGVQKHLVVEVSQTLAQQQADRIDHLLEQLEQRLLMAASSPLALSAVASKDPADIPLVEKTMLDYFPRASSLRLIKLDGRGTAGLEERNLGLRNHIEVDLLRRTSQGEETGPESYRFEERWLTSVARQVIHPRTGEDGAVVMATFDNQLLTDALARKQGDSGRSSLQQLYSKGKFKRADEIAISGEGSRRSFEASTELNDGKWVLVFTPSAKLIDSLEIESSHLTGIMGLSVLALLLASGAALIMTRKTLVNEVEQISKAAGNRTETLLRVPELLPLARKLRQAMHRGGGKGAGKRQRANASQDLSDPLFQKTDIVDEVDDFPAHAPAPMEEAELIHVDLVPAHIFRAYDIRGIADTELGDANVELIGRGIAAMAAEQGQESFLVACDGRNTSPRIKNALVKALLSSGADVMDIGSVPTPLLYFATHTLDCRSGIMVTGSHNPAEYNGLKIVIDGNAVAGDEIEALRKIVESERFIEGAGRLAKKDILEDYVETVVTDMAIAVPLKIVVDAGNGIGGVVVPLLMEELGCDLVPMYCDVDGDFPNHHPDPSDENNLKDLAAEVVAQGADFGVALDGDADRLCVVNSNGDIIRNDKLLTIFAKDVVSRNPGADVLFDVKCSRHLTQLVSRYGGRPIMWKTGHSFMKEKMQETGALLGGEFSGHMFFGERWFGFDDGLYSLARLAEIVSASPDGLDGLLVDFPDSLSTPEIRIAVAEEEKFKLVEQLAAEGDFAPGKLTNLDGVRVDFADGWGLIRASNTVPALTARFEADNSEALDRIKGQFREQLAMVDPALEPGF